MFGVRNDEGARKKIEFLADASAKGEGGLTPPRPPKKMHGLFIKKKYAWNFLKQKNLQKYFVNFLQGYPLNIEIEVFYL